jgi:glycosyltransferase involved in cell wall biosynthesis
MNGRTSVIVPVRNGVRFITEAVDSVLPQLARDDEIVVIDDASTDDTRSVLARMQDRRIHVIDGAGRGVSSARNIGLTVATGEFISFLDHDDMWSPGRHAALLQALLADTKTDCAIGRIRLRLEHDAIMLPNLADLEGQITPKLVVGTALFRRRIIDRVGGFDEEMRFCEDIDYFVRLMEQNYRFVLCDVDALIYRRHSTNATCDVTGAQQGMLQMMRRRRDRMSSHGSGR